MNEAKPISKELEAAFNEPFVLYHNQWLYLSISGVFPEATFSIVDREGNNKYSGDLNGLEMHRFNIPLLSGVYTLTILNDSSRIVRKLFL